MAFCLLLYDPVISVYLITQQEIVRSSSYFGFSTNYQRWASQRFFDSSQVKSFSKNFKSSQVKSSSVQEISKSSQVKSSSVQEISKSSQVKSWPKIIQVKSKSKPALIKFYFIREGSRYDTFILFQRKMIFQTKFHNK